MSTVSLKELSSRMLMQGDHIELQNGVCSLFDVNGFCIQRDINLVQFAFANDFLQRPDQLDYNEPELARHREHQANKFDPNRVIHQENSLHISYESGNLTVWQGCEEFEISIGPVGLIEVGLKLCGIGRGTLVLTARDSIYRHIDGLFFINFHEQSGELEFVTYDDNSVSVRLDLIEFGLKLIERGKRDCEDTIAKTYGTRIHWSRAA